MKEISRAGKYEILERIGVGGFGTVYKGRDPFIKRTVAIKTCSTDDEGIRRRFLREAEIAGNLQHPNITLLYDFGYEEGIPYLVQEFLTGVDLQHLIDVRADIPVETKVDYLRQTAAGLLFAHENGVLHRDIKPSNLRLLDDGRIKILDFGIAKLASQETKLTHTGITLGTPAYLAPEQLRGEEVDARADIYSFGVVAFELFTYERMFDANSISALFYQILNEKGRRLSEVWHVAPPQLEAFLGQCTALEPNDRFPSFRDVLERLDSLEVQLPGDMPTAAIDPGATAVLSPDLIESVVEKERAAAIENARSAVMKQVDEGNLAGANAALARAVEKFGEIAPLRTLSERIAEVESQIAESDRRRRINSALDEIEAHLGQGDLTSAEIRLSELEQEAPDRQELTGLRQRLDAAQTAARRGRAEQLERGRALFEESLSRGELEESEKALALVEENADDDALALELRERLDRHRLSQAVGGAVSSVRAALEERRLDDAEIALEEARGRLGTHPDFQSLASELEEARRLTELDARLDEIRGLLAAGDFDGVEAALSVFRSNHGAHPGLAELEERLASARQEVALRQVVDEITRALHGDSAEPALQLLETAIAQYGEHPLLAALSERAERRQRELALGAAVDEIETLLESGDLEGAEATVAATRSRWGRDTQLDLMVSRIEALRLEARVATALDAVAQALESDGLEQARGLLERSRAELGGALEEHERFVEIAREMERRLAEQRRERAAAELQKSQSALAAHDLESAVRHARSALEFDPGNAEARGLLQTAEAARAKELEDQRRAEARRLTELETEALLDRGRLRAATRRLARDVDDHGWSESLEALERRLDRARAEAPGLSPALLWGGVAAAVVLVAVIAWVLIRPDGETSPVAADSGLELLATPWARVVAVRDADDHDHLSVEGGEVTPQYTPLVLRLPPGTYTVILELPGGGKETREVTLTAGSTWRESVAPAPIDLDAYFEAVGWQP